MNTSKSIDLQSLRTACPFPTLLKQLGLGRYACSSCSSPLRPDEKPSWGIYQNDGRWFFKDHGNNDGGDEITFLARHLKLDPKKDFARILAYYSDVASNAPVEPQEIFGKTVGAKGKPNKDGFNPGTSDQLDRLAALRGYDWSILNLLSERGLLVFGYLANHEVFGITDSSDRILEVRRLDGQVFPAYGSLPERKSHSVKGTQKNWPLGILEAEKYPMILLCEGVPDFLAAGQVIQNEGALERVAAVSMLGASNRISDDALPYFKGKAVRIVPHQDKAGVKAAGVWKNQLMNAGANRVDFVDLGQFQTSEAPSIKDLDDFKQLHAANINNQQWRILE